MEDLRSQEILGFAQNDSIETHYGFIVETVGKLGSRPVFCYTIFAC